MLKDNQYKPSNCEEDLLQFISQEQLYKLEQRWRCQYIYIYAKPSQEMVELIGQAAAQILSDNFSCECVYVPGCLFRHIRNESIKNEINAGETIQDLAAKYRLKTPAIKMMLKHKYGYTDDDKVKANENRDNQQS